MSDYPLQEGWVVLFSILLIVGVFAAEGLVIGFAIMGLSVVGISWIWNKVSLEELTYERHLERERLFIGEEISLEITVTNKKPVPLGRVSVEDEFAKEIELTVAATGDRATASDSALRHSTSLAWYERIRWVYRLTCNQRGLYSFGPARIVSGDLFGFFRSESSESSSDYLLVYPRVLPLPEMGLPATRPLGEVAGGMRIFEDPSRPKSIRQYQQGDPLKIVDWKSSAKRGELQVRTYEPSSTFTVMLCMAVETSERLWEGYSPVHLERVIVATASLASYVTERQHTVGLFSNGMPVLSHRMAGPPIVAQEPMKIPASRSPEQLTAILEALATVRPLAMSSMDTQLGGYARQLPMGATIVLVAAFVSSRLVEVVGDLRRGGHKIVVVYVGDDSCPDMPEGVLVHEIGGHLARMELSSEFGPR